MFYNNKHNTTYKGKVSIVLNRRSLTIIARIMVNYNHFQVTINTLVLNADKSKTTLFSNGKRLPSYLPSLTVYGVETEMVTSYKYLGILIDENLSFKLHIDKLVSKLKLKLGCFFRNKSCFSLQGRKYLLTTTFLPLLDYEDLLFMKLHTVYHCALHYITDCSYHVHYCSLYAVAHCSYLSLHL